MVNFFRNNIFISKSDSNTELTIFEPVPWSEFFYDYVFWLVLGYAFLCILLTLYLGNRFLNKLVRDTKNLK